MQEGRSTLAVTATDHIRRMVAALPNGFSVRQADGR